MYDAIEIATLCKRYENISALNEVSASVPMGHVVGLLGHNGAGKSTLFKLILGLALPTRGSVKVLGETPWGHGAHDLRQRMGYLPESVAFYGNLTGLEVISYLAHLKNAPQQQARQLLERVGLDRSAKQRVGTYSKGMRQRLGLAQALLGSPEVLLLDEPTAGLDPQATREMYAVVAELRAAGRCVLISSHLLAELEPHIDSALILRHGHLIASGSFEALRKQAGLPSVIVVKLKSGTNSSTVTQLLNDFHIVHELRPDGGLVIQAPEQEKVELLRIILAQSVVADIEVKEPTLGRLYDCLGAAQAEAPGASS
ncbi:MAG: ABC transporter ATP-binding protein [Candidimonas sp.]|nr:MAG: ABC transporter ATP-binding protein [Candidimonas sp.]TAM23926.1 MAG: ABC transporter ATP-binding protein [Candidimonas sp.]